MALPNPQPKAPVKLCLWLYFWLLLLEGALRKWILPDFSDLLFIIRDPVALITYVFAIRAGVFPWRPAIVVLWLLAALSLAFSLVGDASFLVTLFGLRTNYLHIPLIFVMALTLDRHDVIRFGRWFMICSVPIVLLMVVQFKAGADSWINVGAGGKVSGQLRGALGHIRPPGPFSFVAGVVSFFGLTAAFVAYGWTQRTVYSRPFLIVATGAVAASLPISISRSLMFAVLVVMLFMSVIAVRDVRRMPVYFGPLIAIGAILLLAVDTIYVQALVVRWDEAMRAGGGNFYSNIVQRLLEEFTLPFTVAAEAPWFGHGIGMGTVAGARLVTGRHVFLLAESELPRIVLELGPVLGFAFIGWRWWLAASLVKKSWSSYLRTGDSLPWLLTGSTFLAVVFGQWGPATSLGFAVLGSGLTLAALNEPVEEAGDDDEDDEEEEDSDEPEMSRSDPKS